jgi:hypothetical protein
MGEKKYKYRNVNLDIAQTEKLQEIIDRDPWLTMNMLVKCALHRFLESLEAGETNVIRFEPSDKKRAI